MKETIFKKCEMQEVDFTNTTISKSIFEDCDLSKTIFNNTDLQNVDFRTSYNFEIDPETNNIKQAKFTLQNIHGLLSKHNITIE